jgi:hypothetical protein
MYAIKDWLIYFLYFFMDDDITFYFHNMFLTLGYSVFSCLKVPRDSG